MTNFVHEVYCHWYLPFLKIIQREGLLHDMFLQKSTHGDTKQLHRFLPTLTRQKIMYIRLLPFSNNNAVDVVLILHTFFAQYER